MVQRDKLPDSDDVVGHGFRMGSHEGEPSDQEDAEGHIVRPGRAQDEPDDAAGHGIRSGRALDEPDDTDGHGVKVRF